MKLHFANSGFVSVPKALVLRGPSLSRVRLRVRYGIVEHPDAGLIVVDGGYAPSIYAQRDLSRLLRAYRTALRPTIDDAGGPHLALARIGARVEDVRHVFVTHFHLDHVGYLEQFPNAEFHVCEEALDELETLPARRLAHRGIFKETMTVSFRPRARMIEAAPNVTLPDPLGSGGRDIFDDGSMIAVPLPGHATGHYGLLFPSLPHTPLYATDAAWTLEGLLEDRERRLALRLVADDYEQARQTSARVREFQRFHRARVLLCHDPEPTPYDLPDPDTLL